jgi:hypothetical protein
VRDDSAKIGKTRLPEDFGGGERRAAHWNSVSWNQRAGSGTVISGATSFREYFYAERFRADWNG